MKMFCLALALAFSAPALAGPVLNDVHSQLNATSVAEVWSPKTLGELRAALFRAKRLGLGISIGGGRHSMGGQQFGAGTLHLDLSRMKKLISLDTENGLAVVEAGIQWPRLVKALLAAQEGREKVWTIRQKQTGADNMSIGGALSSNVHGRGLTMAPFVEDVESFWLLDARGRHLRCSRKENPELFRLVIGGYGLFGIITQVELRLVERAKVERQVELAAVDSVVALLEKKAREGAIYGDFQFSTDAVSNTFLKDGVVSTYHRLPKDAHLPPGEKELSPEDWKELYLLAHVNKKAAYERYTSYYLSTQGQRYWADTAQLGVYLPGYHDAIDAATQAPVKGSEMISEVYVPRDKLGAFMGLVRGDFRTHGTNVIYGTVRLIEQDQETFLPWAKQRYAAIVFNLHVDHDGPGLARAREEFQRLIGRALSFGGNYYLTYHRWASPDQVAEGYPEMKRFLGKKKHYDPGELFRSDWYRAMKRTVEAP
jgi:FAD/FMN-containing dehydrogenase